MEQFPTAERPAGASLNSTANFSFGRLQNAINYYAGSLDEIAVYTSVLSGATVSSHYASPERVCRMLSKAGARSRPCHQGAPCAGSAGSSRHIACIDVDHDAQIDTVTVDVEVGNSAASPSTLTDNDTIAITVTYGLFTTAADIGSGAARPASSSYASGVYTKVGNGADIWGPPDQFHYLYKSWTGDGTIIARVTSLGNSQLGAKAAVMFRETTDTGSKIVMMDVQPATRNAAEWRIAAPRAAAPPTPQSKGSTPPSG